VQTGSAPFVVRFTELIALPSGLWTCTCTRKAPLTLAPAAGFTMEITGTFVSATLLPGFVPQAGTLTAVVVTGFVPETPSPSVNVAR
jgi:hypothetical protein